MDIHRTLAVVLVAALAGALPALPGRAAATPVSADPSVTLVTGDRIILGERVGVRPGAGRAGMSFATGVERGHLFVVPADALDLVAGGRLDRRLFDVTALHDAGYDDARTAVLPPVAAPEPRLAPRAEERTVTLRHVGRDGAAASAYAVVVQGYDTTVDVHPYDPSGTVSVRLPVGRYLITSWIRDPAGGQSVLVQPWVDLTQHDVEVTVDARAAKPVTMTAPSEHARMMLGSVQYYGADGELQGGVIADLTFDGVTVGQVGPAAPRGRFVATAVAHFAAPGADGDFADSPYRYNTALTRPDRMFDGVQSRPGAGDFVAVRQRDDEPGQAARVMLGISGAPPGIRPRVLWDYPVLSTPDADRVEYFTTAGVHWWQAYQRWGPDFETLPAEYLAWQPARAGETRWGSPVIGPALPTGRPPAAARSGDVLRLALPLHAPGLPNAGGVSPVTAARTALYRDGTLVAESAQPGQLRAEVPAGAAEYRVEAHATRDVVPTSTRVAATWTFRSARTPADEPLPLLAVRLGPRAPELPVWIEWQRPGTATLRELTVEVSYDDGAQWLPAPVVACGAAWTARPPAGTGPMSVRARATDSLGATVEETIIRAYGDR